MKHKYIFLVLLITFSFSAHSQQDTIPPEFNTIPNDTIVSCMVLVPSPPAITASDNGTSIPIDYTETITDSICRNQLFVNRIWTATDNSGNTASVKQIVIVNDTIAPVLPEIPRDTVVTNPEQIPPIPLAIRATDNCGLVATAFFEVILDFIDDNNFIINRTWESTDDCGNYVFGVQEIIITDKMTSATSAIDFSLSSISIYPNPSNGDFSISGVKGQLISVYSSNGNLVAKKIANSNTEHFNLKLAKGIYYICTPEKSKKLIIK
ncbi:T9SS type A sorting domain-containing protein [Maribellus comscasis]|uniref:T9SS type A sorting domain-containing protein n=1 Tax=Maribellus comscasis TaxID=2681766 RepID=A0A6I6JIC2_9BACT|nr:T9SS type A sorting domain-containing protein [Maribellus comscasis]QGY42486.1 T9SS type A sorting domain-containing protein [Maribellus comscasis]